MNLSEELKWRGFVHQTTFTNLSELDEENRTFYWGVDPSASSMTVGNLAAALMAKVFLKHGWKAILLVGGATGMIGDPDGKKQERDLLTLEQIDQNKKSIADQYAQVFNGLEFTLVDNYDWFKDINYLEFLRDTGKHIPLTQMLDKAFIKDRVGEGGAGISYAEFSYALIQGYDYLHLYREFGASVQLCGADQWGNSIAGVDLIRRIESGEAHVYSCPLIVDRDGKKFGKSEGNAIWLDPELTSPYQFYQFWLNADDQMVGEYIKKYTEISQEDYDKLMTEFEDRPQSRAAQKYLAFEATKIVHGEKTANAVQRATQALFGNLEFADLDQADLDILKQELPTASTGSTVAQTLSEAGLTSSNSESRRLIKDKAVSLNGKKVEDADFIISEPSLLKKGKNSYVYIC